MSRLSSIFADLRARNAKAIMPFICGGHPSPGTTARTLLALERAGASVVEVGIPFSDPIADGPIIAAAMHDALSRGVTPQHVFDEIAQARQSGVTLGIVVMVSVSIAWRLGPQRLVELATRAGVDGFIFPDLPPEEGRDLLRHVRAAGLDTILLIAPTTTPERARLIVQGREGEKGGCSGFIYLLARAGITGESTTSPSADIAPRIRELRQLTSLPIACGFGISSAEHVRAVVHAGGADAAIVGSALVRRMGEARDDDPTAAAAAMVRELAKGLEAHHVPRSGG